MWSIYAEIVSKNALFINNSFGYCEVFHNPVLEPTFKNCISYGCIDESRPIHCSILTGTARSGTAGVNDKVHRPRRQLRIRHLRITACTVVQAVVSAMGLDNGRVRFWPPNASRPLDRFTSNLKSITTCRTRPSTKNFSGLCRRGWSGQIASLTHESFCPFFPYLVTPTGRIFEHIPTLNTLLCVVPAKGLPFGG